MRRSVISIPAIVVLVFAAALGLPPFHGAGWFWDLANGLGFASLAGLLVLFVSSAKPIGVTAHKHLGFAAFGFAVAHILMLLLGDGAVVTYLRTGAPVYMWVGLVATALFIALLWHSVQPLRTTLHGNFSAFGWWHRWLAIVCLGLAVWHIAASQFYLRTLPQVLVICLFAAGIVMRPLIKNYLIQPKPNSWLVYGLASAFACILFILLRNYPL